jgi:hypothetical protein
MSASNMQEEIAAIQSVVARIAHHIDAKRWDELRRLYADEVETDYTSLFGGTPQRQRGDDLIAGWRGALASISTQHLLGPIDVTIDGASATAECHVRAWHLARGTPGGDEWVVAGHYHFALARGDGTWRITAMKLETLQQRGNRNLLAEAAGPK